MRANSRPESNDGRSPTRTTFYATDVDRHAPGQQHRDPTDRRSWKSLAKWQDGVQSDISRGGQNWAADKQRWVDTITSQLAVSDYQQQRVTHILEQLDLTPYQAGHHPVEHVILALTTLVIDQDITDWGDRALARPAVTALGRDLEVGFDPDETTTTDAQTDAVLVGLRHLRKRLKQIDGEHIFDS